MKEKKISIEEIFYKSGIFLPNANYLDYYYHAIHLRLALNNIYDSMNKLYYMEPKNPEDGNAINGLFSILLSTKNQIIENIIKSCSFYYIQINDLFKEIKTFREVKKFWGTGNGHHLIKIAKASNFDLTKEEIRVIKSYNSANWVGRFPHSQDANEYYKMIDEKLRFNIDDIEVIDGLIIRIAEYVKMSHHLPKLIPLK